MSMVKKQNEFAKYAAHCGKFSTYSN